MKDERLEYKLSINNCFKVFDQSFSRVKYFSCLANNLDLDSFPISWTIQNPSGLNYMVKAPRNQEEKQIILDGYKHFMHCYLVRDCIESFAISLDRLFFILLLNGKKVLTSQTLLDALSEDERKLLQKFENAGLSSKEGKIQLLKTHFGLELTEDHKKIIAGLRDMRNCFAHGNGFVRRTDGKKDGKEKRKFTWRTMSIFTKGEKSGKEYPIEFDKPLQEAGMVCMRIENHEKSFKIRQQLSFSPAEAYEIAFSLQQVGRNFMEEINQKLNVRNEDAA